MVFEIKPQVCNSHLKKEKTKVSGVEMFLIPFERNSGF